MKIRRRVSRNVDLNAELKRKDEDLRKAEDSRKKAEELVKENAKKLEDSHATLLACMQEAKVAIDTAFVKGDTESSGVLPKADLAAFLAWLQAKLGQFSQLLENVADFGAYGATLDVARCFRPLDVII